MILCTHCECQCLAQHVPYCMSKFGCNHRVTDSSSWLTWCLLSSAEASPEPESKLARKGAASFLAEISTNICTPVLTPFGKWDIIILPTCDMNYLPCAEASSEPESKSAGKGAGSFLAGAAVNGLYTGLKFTGLAVRVASGLAASIGKDAEAAMARSRAAEQEQRLAAEQVSSMHIFACPMPLCM